MGKFLKNLFFKNTKCSSIKPFNGSNKNQSA
jgi:hypothetical protein